jgi:DtxR family Mn-dependent transcriptional regulator
MQHELHDSSIRSEAIANCLKAVYFLEKQVKPVPTTLLAQALHISAPSVTDLIKRLAGVEEEKDKNPKHDDKHKTVAPLLEETPLLIYERYKGVYLSDAGNQIALEVIRHHRLI